MKNSTNKATKTVKASKMMVRAEYSPISRVTVSDDRLNFKEYSTISKLTASPFHILTGIAKFRHNLAVNGRILNAIRTADAVIEARGKGGSKKTSRKTGERDMFGLPKGGPSSIAMAMIFNSPNTYTMKHVKRITGHTYYRCIRELKADGIKITTSNKGLISVSLA